MMIIKATIDSNKAALNMHTEDERDFIFVENPSSMFPEWPIGFAPGIFASG